MQLEDLRQGWLNPPESIAPINSAQLEKLLANRPGLVHKMRRNARWELAFTAVIMVGPAFLWGAATTPLYKLYVVLSVVMGLGLLYYYYRLLAVLNRMELVESNVRSHLQQLAASLRALLRFYYRLSLAMGPLTMVVNFGYFLGLEVARPGPFRWEKMLSVAGILLVAGILIQVMAVYGTRWVIQRLYGQHLDRLEANLGELGDEPAA